MHGQTCTERHPACRWRKSNRGFRRLRSRWGLPLILLAIPVLIYVVHFTAGHYRDAYTDDDLYRLSGLLRVQPGMTMAEIGAGEGRATAFMANQVGPSGMILSTEIDEDRLADIRQTAAEAGHQNVTALLGTARETNLPAACCDAIFLVKVYHHFTEPAAINRSIFESLKPGGRLAVVDFPPSPWVFGWGIPTEFPRIAAATARHGKFSSKSWNKPVSLSSRTSRTGGPGRSSASASSRANRTAPPDAPDKRISEALTGLSNARAGAATVLSSAVKSRS